MIFLTPFPHPVSFSSYDSSFRSLYCSGLVENNFYLELKKKKPQKHQPMTDSTVIAIIVTCLLVLVFAIFAAVYFYRRRHREVPISRREVR